MGKQTLCENQLDYVFCEVRRFSTVVEEEGVTLSELQ